MQYKLAGNSERSLKNRPYKQEDKPDIVTRIFQMKVTDMIAYIKSSKPFGRTLTGAYNFVVCCSSS
jgi:hypothetical protein